MVLFLGLLSHWIFLKTKLFFQDYEFIDHFSKLVIKYSTVKFELYYYFLNEIWP